MLQVEWLGQIEYVDALAKQKALVAARTEQPTLPDKLLLLEHPPTYTFGIRGDRSHLLLDEATLQAQGFTLHQVRRGGDVTYHGPGQLVGYPICHLKRINERLGRRRVDVHSFVRDIEEVIIQALATFGIVAQRFKGFTGVWVEANGELRKIAAIGIHVAGRERITSHGFALNVMPDMSHFANIVPCGITDYGVVSMAELLERPLTTIDLLEPIINAFGRVFEIKELKRET